MSCQRITASAIASCLVLTAIVMAVFAGASFAQQPDTVRALAAENLALAAQIDEAATAFGRTSAELANLLKTSGDLKERMERIQRRAEVQAIGQELARTLVQELR